MNLHRHRHQIQYHRWYQRIVELVKIERIVDSMQDDDDDDDDEEGSSFCHHDIVMVMMM